MPHLNANGIIQKEVTAISLTHRIGHTTFPSHKRGNEDGHNTGVQSSRSSGRKPSKGRYRAGGSRRADEFQETSGEEGDSKKRLKTSVAPRVPSENQRTAQKVSGTDGGSNQGVLMNPAQARCRAGTRAECSYEKNFGRKCRLQHSDE